MNPDAEFTYRHAYSAVNQAESFFSHHHLSYELLYVIRGEGSFVMGTHSYKIGDGTLILVPPGEYHVMNTMRDRVYERFVMNFPAAWFPPTVELRRAVVSHPGEKTVDVIRRMTAYEESFSPENCRLLLPALLTELLIVLESEKEMSASDRRRLPPIVTGAICYIRDHVKEPLSVDRVAEALYVSRSYLHHSFKNTMSLGVMAYIRLQKMLAARDMIEKGTPPTVVASSLGFPSYATFLRNYRAEFGKNPSETRKERKG